MPVSFFDVASDYDIVVIAKATLYDQLIKGMSDINKRLERVPEVMASEGRTLVFVPKSWTSVTKRFGVFTKTQEDSWWASVTVRNGESVYQIIGCELETNSIHIRQRQLRELANIREKEIPSFIACDSKIMRYQDERFEPPEGFSDAWISAGDMSNQFTREGGRQDRVWFSNSKPLSYEIIDFRRNTTGIGVEFI